MITFTTRRQGSHPDGGKRGPFQKEKVCLSQSAQRAGSRRQAPAKSLQIITEIGGNRKYEIFGACWGRSKALRIQRVRTVNLSIPIFKFLFIFEFYLGTTCWKSERLYPFWFEVPDQSMQGNGIWNTPRVPNPIFRTWRRFIEGWSESWMNGSVLLLMRCLMGSSKNFCRSDDLEGSKCGLINFSNGFVTFALETRSIVENLFTSSSWT